MATIADELNAISVEHGYTGAAPKTIAGAIDALADTLAGTDVEGKRTIAGAVKALAPYIGGSGGGALGVGYNVFVTGASSFTVVASDDQLDLPPVGKMGFASSDGQSLVVLPAGVNVCFNLSSSNSGFTVTNESTGEEVESVMKEYEQHGLTYHYLYFVMPDSNVSVSNA